MADDELQKKTSLKRTTNDEEAAKKMFLAPNWSAEKGIEIYGWAYGLGLVSWLFKLKDELITL